MLLHHREIPVMVEKSTEYCENTGEVRRAQRLIWGERTSRNVSQMREAWMESWRTGWTHPDKEEKGVGFCTCVLAEGVSAQVKGKRKFKRQKSKKEVHSWFWELQAGKWLGVIKQRLQAEGWKTEMGEVGSSSPRRNHHIMLTCLHFYQTYCGAIERF